ncbi:MAG: hypothetical protein J6252_01355 [Clostridia bacterium]|nr:hypothetical protein [Clostridia bacterium]
MKNVLSALREFVSRRKKVLLGAVSAIVMIGLVIAAVASVSVRKKPGGWDACPLTEGIPEFPAEAYSFTVNGSSCAAYYEDVSGDRINEYADLLKEKCGAEFSEGAFPRTAQIGGRTVILHYNVTEKNFSITITGNGADTNDEN